MTKRNRAGIAAVAALATASAQAAEGDWLVRVRALHMSPSNDNSTTTVVPALGEVKAEDKLFPEVDISYFFTPHIAALVVRLWWATARPVSARAGDIPVRRRQAAEPAILQELTRRA